MIDITRQCMVRIEKGAGHRVDSQSMLIYIHLGWNDNLTRKGAIGYIDLLGFHVMTPYEGKIRAVLDSTEGWFSIEMDKNSYVEHCRSCE